MFISYVDQLVEDFYIFILDLSLALETLIYTTTCIYIVLILVYYHLNELTLQNTDFNTTDTQNKH